MMRITKGQSRKNRQVKSTNITQDLLSKAIQPVFEQLEGRRLLTTVYVNNDWVVTNDVGPDGLSAGDTVDNSADYSASSPHYVSGKIYGTDAFDTIASAVTALHSSTDAANTIHVVTGTYTTQATIDLANTTVEADSAGVDPNTNPGGRAPEVLLQASNGSLIVAANNVSIDGFTVQQAIGPAASGIQVNGPSAGTVIKNNIIQDNITGVTIGSGAGNFTVDNNLIANNSRSGANRSEGVRVVGNTGVTNQIIDNVFKDHSATAASPGAVTLVGASNVQVGAAGHGNTFVNNRVGVRVEGNTTNSPIAANNFDSSNTTYIDNVSANGVDATGGNTFGGITPSVGNLAGDYAVVDKINDGVDAAGRGLVRIVAGNVYVTPNSFLAPTTTTPSIQRGIDVASAGDTVHVESGTYNESPQINKSVTVAGDGRDTTTINLLAADATGAPYLGALTIGGAGSNVTLSGFTIVGNDAVGSGLANTDIRIASDGVGTVNIQNNRLKVGNTGPGANGDDGMGLVTDYTETPSQFINTLNVSGNDILPTNAQANRAFYINTGTTNFNFTNNNVTGTFLGRAFTEANNGLIQNNTVTGTGAAGSRSAGFGTFGDTDKTQYGHTNFDGNTFTNLGKAISVLSANNTQIQNNHFNNNDIAISIDNSFGPNGPLTTFSGNTFTGNTIDIFDNDPGANDVTPSGTNVFDGVTLGSATDAQLYAIEDKIVDAIDVPAYGFVRLKANNVYVTPNSFYTPGGTTAPDVQRGVNVADSGDTVNIQDGTYTNQVEITKNVTLLGQSEAGTIIKSPASLPLSFTTSGPNHPVIYIHGTDANVENLTVDGDGKGGGSNNRIVGIGMNNAGGTIDHVTIQHVRQTPLNGVQEGVAILNSSTAAHTLNVTNSTLFDYQKNGMVLDGSGLTANVDHNTVTGAGDTTLIAQNGIQLSNGAVGHITNNTVSGHEYSGPSGGSDFLNDTQSVGILLNEAGDNTTIDGNTVDSNDIGIYSWDQGDVSITNNHLGNTGANRYEGILVDESTSTITGNTVKGGNVGIAVVAFDVGNSHPDSAAVIGGATPALGNTISSTGVGIYVLDQTSSDDAQALARIENNSIKGNGAGPNTIGIKVEGGAIVDAGSDNGVDGNPTGLGNSSGNNDLSGYTGVATGPNGEGHYAVVDLNQTVAAGGTGKNVYARHNNWGANISNPAVIEGVIYDDTDDATRTQVLFEPPQNQVGTEPIVYVDKDWAGTPLGADPDGAGPATHFGQDAFASIQDGIDAVTNNGHVIVYHSSSGNYVENVDVNKSIHLDGDTVGGTGGGGAVIVNGVTAGSNVITVGANDVEIDDFTVDGLNGTKGRYGIVTDQSATGPITGTNIHDNTVTGIFRRGIQLDTDFGTFTIANNTVTNVNGDPSASIAITIFDGSGTISGNHVSASNDGIVANNSRGINFTGNTVVIQGSGGGIHTDNALNGPADVISGNHISHDASAGAGAIGIFAFNGNKDVTISGNDVTGVDTGLGMYGTQGDNSSTVTFSGNTVTGSTTAGIDVTTNTFGLNGDQNVHAVISGNTITNSAIGVRVTSTGTATATATVSGTNFDGATDNGTDLQIGAGTAVTIGNGNSFAGDGYFINNQSATNYDLTANSTTFDESNNYRIEDKMFHKVDDTSKGLITWVAHNTFVTAPGSHSVGTTDTDSSIQRGIDATPAGDTLNIEGGTYHENVTISKAITLDGEGTGPGSVTWGGANSNAVITILSTTPTDNISVKDIGFDANGANYAILSNANANYGTLSVDNSSFQHFVTNAISINGDTTNGVSARNIVVSNSTFSHNGTVGGGGSGDISIFMYNGDASFTHDTLSGNAGNNTGEQVGIQLRGVGNNSTGVGHKSMGTVSFNDVDIAGSYVRSPLGIQDYSDVNNLTFHDVKLGGATSKITGTFGDLLRFDGVGAGTTTSPSTVDLGNTYFRGLDPSSPIQSYLEFAPASYGFLRADATNTQWNLPVGGNNLTASSFTNAQAFEAEDRILDYVDNIGAATFKGWAELKDGNAFITATVAGPINGDVISRGVEMVDTGGTVWVNDGTYNQDVVIGKSVSLLSANGSSVTTINGQNTGFTGAVKVNSGVNNVTIGGPSKGFTINGAGQAAVYLEGNNSNVTVRANTIHSASGQNALLTGGGEHNDTISDNTFTGSSAQLVYVNGTADVNVASDHVDFNHNIFSGSATGPLLGINADNSSITSNTFSGNAPVRIGTFVSTLTITNNTFSNSPTDPSAEQFDATGSPGGYDIPGIVAANTFDRAVTVQHPTNYLQAIWANIQGGVNASSNGDTVHASAGNYDPQVNVNKSITLKGAQAGVAANTLAHNATRSGGETQVNNGFVVSANDVTIDGFLIQGTDGVDDQNAGVYLDGAHSGYSVVNNIVRGNVIGVYLNSNGTHATLLQHNLFDDNNNPGPAGQTAIYSDAGLQNASIDTNKFTLNPSAITIGATPSTVNDNITITHNDLIDDGSIYILKASNVTIDHNTLSDTNTGPAPVSSGVRLGGGDSNIHVLSNNISHRTAAVRVINDDVSNGTAFGANTNIDVSGNTLSGNDIGVQVESGTATISGSNSITGNTTGVDLIGGSTTVSGNTITGNTGSGISASGSNTKAKIQSNTLTGNHVGIHVQNDAIVDAGSNATFDGNPTGLGNSTGGNTLTGYTGTGGNYAIEDLNKTVAAGGLGRDVYARSNNFGTTTTAATEAVIFDDTDDSTRTKVIFSQFAVTGTTIDLTSDSTSPNGSSTDNITNINTPSFAGTTAPGATVQVGTWVDANNDGLVDPSEVTLRAPATTANGSGNWALTLTSPLPDGTYKFVAKATDTSSNVDFSAPLTVTIDTNVTVNSTPDMTASTDTGASNTDNRTSDNTPTFDGHTEPNSFVELLLDGTTVIATGSANGSGDWELTSNMAIPNGTHSISARVTDIAGNIGTSAPLNFVIIDTAGPTPPTGSFDLNGIPPTPAQHMDVSFAFDEDVDPSVQNTDLHLKNLTTNSDINSNDIIAHFRPDNTVYFTFADGTYFNGILPDGNYHGFINGSDIQDVAGNQMTGQAAVDFFFLNGDANRDRVINTLDFNILASNFNQSGKLFQDGDFNWDGVVNALDFNVLATKFGTTLPAPAAPLGGLVSAGSTGTSGDKVSNSVLFSSTPVQDIKSEPASSDTSLASDVLS